ncbi:MAG: hypothetical protein HQK96_19050 [Nitrospirae bacterium]|nr:hypothetical protein [Nitrospirota bacterium]
MSGKIRDTGPTKRRVDPNVIAKALGAEDTKVDIDVRRGPISLFSLRQFLVDRLRSADSQCKLEGTGEKCNEILFSNEDWEKLEKIAKYYREKEGINISCNQIVSALIQAVKFPDDKKKAEHPWITLKARTKG